MEKSKKREKNSLKILGIFLLVIGFIMVFQSGFIETAEEFCDPEAADPRCASGEFCSDGNVVTEYCADDRTCQENVQESCGASCVSGECIACESDSDCTGGYCQSPGTTYSECVECEEDSHCEGDGDGLDYCYGNECVECELDSHCNSGSDMEYYCSSWSCESCDGDNDGFDASACGGEDCNDNNASIHPGAEEKCNGVDMNCDGNVDEGTGICSGSKYCTGGSIDCGAYDKNTCPTQDGCVLCEGECIVYGYTSTFYDPESGEYTQEMLDTGTVVSSCSDGAADCAETCPEGHKCKHEPYNEIQCRGVGNSCGDNSKYCEEDYEGCYWKYPESDDCDATERDSCSIVDGCSWHCCEYHENCYGDVDGDGDGDPDNTTQSYCDGSCPDGYVRDNNYDCNDDVKCLNSSTTWYKDADGDDYYSTKAPNHCPRPGSDWYLDRSECTYEYSKEFEGGGDCNDNSVDANLGIPNETVEDSYKCDGLDNDCNDFTDDEEEYIDCCDDADCDTGVCGSDNTCAEPDAYWSDTIQSPEENEITSRELKQKDPDEAFPSDSYYLVVDNTGLDSCEGCVSFNIRELDTSTTDFVNDNIKTVNGSVDSNGRAYAEIQITYNDVDEGSSGSEESIPDQYSSETWEFWFNFYDDVDGNGNKIYDGKDNDKIFHFSWNRNLVGTCETNGMYTQGTSCTDYNNMRGLSDNEIRNYCEDDSCGVNSEEECVDDDLVREYCYWDEENGCQSGEEDLTPDSSECIEGCNRSHECWMNTDIYSENTCNIEGSCECADGYIATDYGYCIGENDDIPSSIGSCFYDESTNDDCSDGLLNVSWTADWNWAEDNNYTGKEDNGNYTCVDGYCHYDPSSKQSECQDGSEVRACPAQIEVPFFNVYNVIAVILAIGLVYYFYLNFDKSKGNSKSGSHKKSGKSKKSSGKSKKSSKKKSGK